MTVADWVQAQKVDPTINQVVYLDEEHEIAYSESGWWDVRGTETISEVMGKLCLQEGVLYRHGNWARQDPNELQLVVPPDYRLEALYGAHNDVGHLVSNGYLTSFRIDFIGQTWRMMPLIIYEPLSTAWWFKGRQNKEELYPLLTTYPLELVHMEFLTMENPWTGVDMNILVIMNHFMHYTKAVVPPTQTAKATAMNLSQIMVFLKNLLTDQGHNFESQLIKDLCKLANIQKVWTTPYHPETNGQCERF